MNSAPPLAVPCMLPKIFDGRNKTFWFFALRRHAPAAKSPSTKTMFRRLQMFNGDFSDIVDNNGVQTHIYDPLTTNAKGFAHAVPRRYHPAEPASARSSRRCSP